MVGDRRLGTYRHTIWRWAEGHVRPNVKHMMALLELANDLGPQPPLHRLRELATAGSPHLTLVAHPRQLVPSARPGYGHRLAAD